MEIPGMNLIDIVKRISMPDPWSEGEKIPWNEPEFSKRMLQYHLAQDHDLASRRFSIIDKHVKFLNDLACGASKVLDLGCGPGFYASRLTRLGHRCKGIDFSPASIDYAKEQAEKVGQDIDYVTEDIRTAEFGDGYGLAMMVYGEFNVFKKDDIGAVLKKAYDSLEEGGVFIAEPHRFEAVKSLGESSPSWYSSESMLFSDKPHLALMECFWVEEHSVTINRYFIVDAATGSVTLHSSSMQAYSNDEYEALLREAGFNEVEFYDSLTGDEVDRNENLMVIVGRK
jgi:SAM-dependent methyltransferase